MHDDDVMDRLLKDAMAAEAPHLSPGFDAAVMRRTRPRRLTAMGRAVIAVYVVVAAAAAMWLMREVPLESVGVALAIGMPVAAGASAYARRVAAGY